MLKYFSIKFITIFATWFIVSFITEIILSLVFEYVLEIKDALSRSVLSSFIFSTFMTFIYWIRFINLGMRPISNKFFDTVQKEVFETDFKVQDVKETIENLFSKKMKQTENGYFILNIFSWRCWSRLRMRQLENSDSQNKFELIAEPTLRLNIFDFGENYSIMKKVCHSLGKTI